MIRARVVLCLIILIAVGMAMPGNKKKNRNSQKAVGREANGRGRDSNTRQPAASRPSNKPAKAGSQKKGSSAGIKDEVGDLTSREWPSDCKMCGRQFPKQILRDVHEMCCDVSGSGPGHLL